MTEYQKIPGPFKRSPETKKLHYREWSTPELEVLADLPIWNFTEKVDGTNVRVLWDGYSVSFAGRTDRATFSSEAGLALANIFGGPDNETLFEEQFGATPAVLYGELYGPKIQNGGIYRDDITFVLFDVKVGDWWLERNNLIDVSEGLGIDLVPLVLEQVTIEDAIVFVSDGYKSVIPVEGKNAIFAEGLVGVTSPTLLTRRGDRIIVKVKHRDFF